MSQTTELFAPTPGQQAPEPPQRDTRRPGPRPQVRRQRWVRLIEPPHHDLAGEERPGMVEIFCSTDKPAVPIRYLVAPEPHPEGLAAFAVTKLPGDETQAVVTYHVVLDGACSSCECLGFLRHGMARGAGCRHVAALAALRRKGVLR